MRNGGIVQIPSSLGVHASGGGQTVETDTSDAPSAMVTASVRLRHLGGSA